MFSLDKVFWKKLWHSICILIVLAVIIVAMLSVVHYIINLFNDSSDADYNLDEQIRVIVRQEQAAFQTNIQILLVFSSAAVAVFGIYIPWRAHEKHSDKIKQLDEKLKEYNDEVKRDLASQALKEKLEQTRGLLLEDTINVSTSASVTNCPCQAAFNYGAKAIRDKDYLTAIIAYQSALHSCKTLKHKATIHSNLCKAYWNINSFELAFYHASAAVSYSPQNARYYYQCGSALREMQHPKEAVEWISEAVRLEKAKDNREERLAIYYAGLAAAYCGLGGEDNFKRARDFDHDAIELCKKAYENACRKCDDDGKKRILSSLRKMYQSHAITHRYTAEKAPTERKAKEHKRLAEDNERRAELSDDMIINAH